MQGSYWGSWVRQQEAFLKPRAAWNGDVERQCWVSLEKGRSLDLWGVGVCQVEWVCCHMLCSACLTSQLPAANPAGHQLSQGSSRSRSVVGNCCSTHKERPKIQQRSSVCVIHNGACCSADSSVNLMLFLWTIWEWGSMKFKNFSSLLCPWHQARRGRSHCLCLPYPFVCQSVLLMILLLSSDASYMNLLQNSICLLL